MTPTLTVSRIALSAIAVAMGGLFGFATCKCFSYASILVWGVPFLRILDGYCRNRRSNLSRRAYFSFNCHIDMVAAFNIPYVMLRGTHYMGLHVVLDVGAQTVDSPRGISLVGGEA